MNFKTELEIVLWKMLLDKQTYINKIISGNETLNKKQVGNLMMEIADNLIEYQNNTDN